MHIPDTYYGRTIDSNGCFHIDKKVTRYIDHACETWFYGHDEFEGGNCVPWMRSRETVDRNNNDVHEMEIINGIWRYSFDA